MFSKRSVVLLAGLFAPLCSPLYGASHALIVTGLSGSSQNAEEFQRLATETKRLLVERGIPADQVDIMGAKSTREMVLEKLHAAEGGASADDEFWLVLYGMGGKARGDVPAFQIGGPRLTAADLKTALDAIPARQYVFIGASESGGFLPVLKSSRRTALSATKEEGEDSWPRFPEAWINAFAENPKASFVRIGARAAAIVEEEYKNAALAQTEHSRLADPVTGTILEPPFGVDLQAPSEVASTKSGPAPLLGASEINVSKVSITKPNAEWEDQPATEETKKIVSEARNTPNPDGHSAIVLQQRLKFVVEDDRTTDELTYYRVYIARDEAVPEWANRLFPQAPPILTTKLEIARVIQADGSATVFNPAKLPACTDPDGGCGARVMVYLPNAKAGCVVELGYRMREVLNPSLPYVTESLPLLQHAPVLSTDVEVRVPEKQAFHVLLKNGHTEPQESSENGRHIYHWNLTSLPAAEFLPGDPPWQQWTPYIAISSLPSWDEFARWYRRLAKGSDDIDDTVKKMAAQLADGAKSRVDKIRRDFEFVSALRYVAIEVGVQGFRPRMPMEVLANNYGDCKDKANLLVALLRSQGIGAKFVLLNRGSWTDVSFPSWQFNHALALVPSAPEAGQPNDLWLDSTDSVTPFGFVPPGDFGRPGLVFNENGAEFKTVMVNASAVSQIQDEWDLKQDAQGWSGSFHRTATGTADDQLRRVFRGLTPAQRSAQVYQVLAGLWPSGDFLKGSVSDPSNIAASMELRAETTAPAADLPQISLPDFIVFNEPSRDRPLWLNDGRSITLTQTVRLHYANAAPEALPAPFQTEAAGQKLSITWERVDAQTIARHAQFDLARPIIPVAEYPALRRVVREWNLALARLH